MRLSLRVPFCILVPDRQPSRKEYEIMGETKAGLRVAVLALLWGSTFLWIDVALGALHPTQLTVTRCALGATVLLLACRMFGLRLPRGLSTWRHIVVAAFFCNALPFMLFSLGQLTVESGLAGVLTATTPLWSMVLGLVLGTEKRCKPARVGGLLLGFGGVILILAPWQESGALGWGALAILGAAASYAVAFTYMQRHLVGSGNATLSLSAAQLLAATALTATTLPLGGVLPEHLSPEILLAVIILGTASTGVTFHLTYRIIADEGATNAATVSYLLPVVAVALGAIVLGEEIGLRVVIGGGVVLAGVALTRAANKTPATPDVKGQ